MAVKFEVIIVADEPNETGSAATSAVTRIAFSKEGYTKHEEALADWLKSTVEELFRTKFKAVQDNVINIEENKNVH